MMAHQQHPSNAVANDFKELPKSIDVMEEVGGRMNASSSHFCPEQRVFRSASPFQSKQSGNHLMAWQTGDIKSNFIDHELDHK